MYKKAFTLIELLIAVAIIGILTSVIIANVSSARNTSKDGAAKASLAQYKTEVELYANGRVSNYTYACDATQPPFQQSRLIQLKTEIENAVKPNGFAECVAVDGVYVYMVGLSSGTGFCIDSTGFGGDIANADLQSFQIDFKNGTPRTTCLP